MKKLNTIINNLENTANELPKLNSEEKEIVLNNIFSCTECGWWLKSNQRGDGDTCTECLEKQLEEGE